MAKIVSSGGTLTTEKYLERKKRARRRKLVLIFISFIILLSLATYVSRISKFRIQNIAVSGAKVIGADTVSEYSGNVLHGYYLWLIPKNNFLLYPRSALETDLKKEFPRFSSVNIALENLNHLNIAVVERDPYALYCADAGTTDANCYFMDKSGFIFDEAPAFSNGVYFSYSATPPLVNPKGRLFLAQNNFIKLGQFLNNLPVLGLHPTALNMTVDDFDITTDHGAHVLWKRSQNINTIYSNLSSFLKSDAITGQKDFLNSVTTLDLRTDNKVYYK